MYKLNFIKYLILVLFLIFEQSANCCINEYRSLLNGELVFTQAGNAARIARFDANNKAYLLEKLKEADSIYSLTGKLEDYSDLGSMLIYNGQYLKAKQIFQNIEQKSPRLYQTAANLGTTYELLGQNDSALYWLKRAIEINPNSHRGSEWIHIKILEAKVIAKGDENYFRTHQILSLDFGEEIIPINKTRLDLENLRKHLQHQLSERMSFIKPKDPIVAQLLFDLGNVNALTIDATSGLQVFELAEKYGYSSEVFKKRKSYFEEIQIKADLRNNSDSWEKRHPMIVLIFIASIFVGGLVVTVLLFRWIKKRLLKKRSKKD